MQLDKYKQRCTALFLVIVFAVSVLTPPLQVFADIQQKERSTKTSPVKLPDAAKSKKPKIDKRGKDPQVLGPLGGGPKVSSMKAAQDATAPTTSSSVLNKTANIKKEIPQDGSKPKKVSSRELTERRSAKKSVHVNPDGSITEKNYVSPKYFQKEGNWVDIDTTLIEDKNAGDATNAFSRSLGQVQSWVGGTSHYTVKNNDWQARFAPSGQEGGMVRMKMGDSQVGFEPVKSNDVKPTILTSKDGRQIVRYINLWDGVDVDYIVESSGLKENIRLKNKSATNAVSFRLVGASLKKQKVGDKLADSYVIKGALNDEFAIAPPNLILNKFGFVSDQKVFGQKVSGNSITLSVDEKYLESLPDDAFPAVIDPNTFRSNFGTRAGGNYVSFKTDGTICYSNVCNPYAGSLLDTNSNVQWWRGAFHSPYDQLNTTTNILTNATLHLTQRSNESFWTGDWGTHNVQVGHATCLHNFHCVDGIWSSANIGGSGDIDVTSLYQSRVAANDYGAWLMVMSEDGTNHSFKNFDPDNSYVSFTYGGPPTAPAVSSPVANQVYTDIQPSFLVNSMGNPNGNTPLEYQMMVSSAPAANGGLIVSPRTTATQWTVPDGILQDGSTYYLQARSFDPITQTYSNWGSSVPFRIDFRTGKDQTQTFDTLGPVDVDLATGNVYTSASSHSSSAIGGSLGISVDYNSPLKSRSGLVGQYWSNGTFSGSPALTRVDQKIDFGWETGSPASGTIPNDNFSAKWKGYFVAPKTATYQFGGSNDDSLTIKVNEQSVYTNGGCYSGVCYGSNIVLQAGQVVPIEVTHQEASGPAYARLYVKAAGVITEKIVPQEWLQTGVRPVSTQRGLIGSYFGRFDNTNTFSTTNQLIMKRIDPYLNFDWGTEAPMPNGPDGFLVRWSGYVTVPATGTYNFGVKSDDGAKITIGSNNTVVYNEWTDRGATESYGTGYGMTENVPVPITIEYYDAGGAASLQLKVQGAVAQQIVPSEWLSSQAQVLPEGWKLGLDPDSGLTYDRLQINQNSAVLTDSTGGTHEYVWTGSGYKPPINEDGQLMRNADGTLTLRDVDGHTYIFDKDGTLKSVTSALDDRKPAALQYTYASVNGSQARLTQITDGVDSSRWAKVFYSGDSECGSVPFGFDSGAPAGMICAVTTNDTRKTYFYYKDLQLSRILKPGSEQIDYNYEAIQNNGVTVGYRLLNIRDSLANDAVNAWTYPNTADANTDLTYDVIGRVVSVKQPAATELGNRLQHTIEYLPGEKSYVDADGITIPGYAGKALQHVIGAVEPQGYSRQVKYDHLFRTIEDTNNVGLSETTEWDQQKDIAYATVDKTGMKTSTVYDDEDRTIFSYGPAPKEWFDATNPKNQIPSSGYVSQVPRVDTAYNESIVGPSVAWHDYSKQTGNTNGTLFGAPKLHTTGINIATPGVLDYDFVNPPVTPSVGMQGIGMSATGKLRLPNGTYTINTTTSDGIRIWVDDQLVVANQWIDSASRTVTSSNFVVNDSVPKRFRIDAYRKTGSTGALSVSILQQNGFASTTNWGNYLKPDYSLITSNKVYDSTIGNTSTVTNYGNTPELGLVQSETIDPTGLNLINNNGYEVQGATGSYLRQTSKTLPGGNTTGYEYYSANGTSSETRDNPCTIEVVETFKQAGQVKKIVDPDPDGSGSQTSRSSEKVYDEAGRVVANRLNNDPWTCTTYDDRGRVLQTVVPMIDGKPGRTVSFNYAEWGNPLYTSIGDETGAIITYIDILGRTLTYQSAYGDYTEYSYDNLGRLTQKASDMGVESYVYDSYNRLLEHKFDNVTLAANTYDAFGRISNIAYSTAGNMSLALGWDNLSRSNSLDFTLGNGTSHITDTVTRSQSGKIVSGTELGQTKAYTYDKAGRLTGATLGTHNWAYGYALCPTDVYNGGNINANKNSNRTSATYTGSGSYSRAYCYDYADRLIYSNDNNAVDPVYDSHGNLTALGNSWAGKHTDLFYDSSDRHTGIWQNWGDDHDISFVRDAADRIVARYETSVRTNYIFQGAWYGFTGEGDAPDFLRDSNWNITEKYILLPGNVLLTIRPNLTEASAKTYSLVNIHGDVFATTNGSGAQTGTYQYDPDGKLLTTTGPNNTAEGTSNGWVGQYQKSSETGIALSPVQMGARLYLPTLARFAQIDPVDGGVENAYGYPADPINKFDLNGEWAWLAVPLVVVLGKFVLSAVSKQAVKTVAPQAVKTGGSQSVKTVAPQVVKNIAPQVVKGGSAQAPKAVPAPPKQVINYTPHALGRMAGTRGGPQMSPQAVQYVVQYGKQSYDPIRNNFRYESWLGRVVVDPNGKVITVISQSQMSRYVR